VPCKSPELEFILDALVRQQLLTSENLLPTQGPRGGRIASTAFKWAHASWDNAKRSILGSDKVERRSGSGRDALATLKRLAREASEKTIRHISQHALGFEALRGDAEGQYGEHHLVLWVLRMTQLEPELGVRAETRQSLFISFVVLYDPWDL
jgi:hypothetical protein